MVSDFIIKNDTDFLSSQIKCKLNWVFNIDLTQKKATKEGN